MTEVCREPYYIKSSTLFYEALIDIESCNKAKKTHHIANEYYDFTLTLQQQSTFKEEKNHKVLREWNCDIEVDLTSL